jgi:uncharacterized protein (DUF885 family)
MRRMSSRLRLRLGIVAAVGAAVVAGSLLHAAQQSEGERLQALINTYAPERRALGGVPERAPGDLAVDLGPTGTPAQADALAAHAQAFLTRLRQIDQSKLTHDEWLDYTVAAAQVQQDAEATAQFFWLPSIVTPYFSPLRVLTAPFAGAPLGTDAQRAAYLKALRQLPATMRAYEVRLEQQAEQRIVLPTEELRLVLPFIRSFAAAPPTSPFSIAPARAAQVPEGARAAFVAEVDALIRDQVNPAVERLASYIDGPYRRRTGDRVGLSQYPHGDAFYRVLIRRNTGLDLTPQQIHDRGLAEVTRIMRALDELRVEAGFSGTLQEFKTYLRTDKRFFAQRSEEIGERMMAAIRLIEPKMSDYFSMMPKAPYDVRRLAPDLEPSMTYGFYSLPTTTDPKGYYNYNGLNPETRSITMVTAIVFHELLPGHHYQLTRVSEHPGISRLRKTVRSVAFTEGWGEYASDVAWEMGVYPDVYAKAGRLGMDLFTSTRLVVDTGMNALGWSRERAMQFMRENTFESEAQIDTETLRYSVDMPGQALAYKLGALAIRDARTRAEQLMGDRFDIRRFHDHLLDAGTVPLAAFDAHFDCLISGERHTRPMLGR